MCGHESVSVNGFWHILVRNRDGAWRRGCVVMTIIFNHNSVSMDTDFLWVLIPKTTPTFRFRFPDLWFITTWMKSDLQSFDSWVVRRYSIPFLLGYIRVHLSLLVRPGFLCLQCNVWFVLTFWKIITRPSPSHDIRYPRYSIPIGDRYLMCIIC